MKNILKGKAATVIILISTFVLAGIAIFTAIRLYQLRQVSVSPNAPESQPNAAGTSDFCDTKGSSFKTPNGFRYCFVINNSIKSSTSATSACKKYGKLASVLNGGEKIADLQSIVSHAGSDNAALLNMIPKPGNGVEVVGLRVADTCAAIVAKYPSPQTSLYWQMPSTRGKMSCGNQYMGFNIKVVDVGNGFFNSKPDNQIVGAVCQLTSATSKPTPTPTPKPGGNQCSLSFSIKTPTPSPTPGPGTPNACGGTCGSDSNCESDLICHSGFCRNPTCTWSTACDCSETPTPAPTAPPGGQSGGQSGGESGGTIEVTPTPIPTPTLAPTPTLTSTTSSPSLPSSGTDWPTVVGAGFGIMAILGSLLLAL